MVVTVDKANLTRPSAGHCSSKFMIALSFAALDPIFWLVETSHPHFLMFPENFLG